MNNEYEQKYLLKKLLIVLFSVIGIIVLLYINKQQYNQDLRTAFKNSEVIMCHDTLIVSDRNWKLLENHLINNNSGGYLLIENCKIKKD